MDSVSSSKSYDKFYEPENGTAFRHRAHKRRRIVIGVLSLVLLAVLTIAIATTIVSIKSKSSKNFSTSTSMSMQTQLKSVCNLTLFPDKCFSSMLPFAANSSTKSKNPALFFTNISIQVAAQEMWKLQGYTSRLMSQASDNRTISALNDCVSLLDDASNRINDSISLMNSKGRRKESLYYSSPAGGELRTWLSTCMTDFDTCLQGLRESNYESIDGVRNFLSNASELLSNSLAIVTKLSENIAPKVRENNGRRRLYGEYPRWVGSGVRRWLQEASPSPNVTVAADGSGDVSTIKEAVALIQNFSNARFVIYVKAGTYQENIKLDINKWNVMIYGDGRTMTIISGSLNFVDGASTYSSATFAAKGKGFIAKDIKFQNTAGAAKQQAVAFRSESDQSVFFRCAFDAFQDTLSAYSGKQFYRDCDVIGTIDFIFGNAAAVFQNCNILPRQPLLGQFNVITAQGKTDPNQNSGFSFQNCTFSPFDDVNVPVYLGRPWGNCATTVIMQSEIGSVVSPAGWALWDSSQDPPPSTILYAEYANTGDGSRTDGRVKWAGYRSNITASEAAKYTVDAFILGGSWLPETTVTYDSSL